MAEFEDEVRLRKLYAPEEEAYIFVRWLVDLGDIVQANQTIAIIESASLTMEVTSYQAGRVAEMNCIVGRPVAEGQLIARIASDPDKGD